MKRVPYASWPFPEKLKVLIQELKIQKASCRQMCSCAWLFSLGLRPDHLVVWIKHIDLFTTVLHGNTGYLPIPLCFSPDNNLYFFYLWQTTSFEKPNTPSPLVREELIMFFLCTLLTECCIVTKCLHRGSIALWESFESGARWPEFWGCCLLALQSSTRPLFSPIKHR